MFLRYFYNKAIKRTPCLHGRTFDGKEIERDARDAAIKPSSGRRARTGGRCVCMDRHLTIKKIDCDARDKSR